MTLFPLISLTQFNYLYKLINFIKNQLFFLKKVLLLNFFYSLIIFPLNSFLHATREKNMPNEDTAFLLSPSPESAHLQALVKDQVAKNFEEILNIVIPPSDSLWILSREVILGGFCG